jgi:hypothetical protein
MKLNPLNAELNPICHLLALLGAHHILHISRLKVKWYKRQRILKVVRGEFRRRIHTQIVYSSYRIAFLINHLFFSNVISTSFKHLLINCLQLKLSSVTI